MGMIDMVKDRREARSIVKQEQSIVKKEPSENTTYENTIVEIKNQIHGIISAMAISESSEKLEGLGENIFQKQAMENSNFFKAKKYVLR